MRALSLIKQRECSEKDVEYLMGQRELYCVSISVDFVPAPIFFLLTEQTDLRYTLRYIVNYSTVDIVLNFANQ